MPPPAHADQASGGRLRPRPEPIVPPPRFDDGASQRQAKPSPPIHSASKASDGSASGRLARAAMTIARRSGRTTDPPRRRRRRRHGPPPRERRPVPRPGPDARARSTSGRSSIAREARTAAIAFARVAAIPHEVGRRRATRGGRVSGRSHREVANLGGQLVEALARPERAVEGPLRVGVAQRLDLTQAAGRDGDWRAHLVHDEVDKRNRTVDMRRILRMPPAARP